MNNYDVTYEENGQELSERIEAVDPGQAFMKCQKLHKGAIMIKAERHGDRINGGFTEYQAPPVQREPTPDPKPPRDAQTEREGLRVFLLRYVSFAENMKFQKPKPLTPCSRCNDTRKIELFFGAIVVPCPDCSQKPTKRCTEGSQALKSLS